MQRKGNRFGDSTGRTARKGKGHVQLGTKSRASHSAFAARAGSADAGRTSTRAHDAPTGWTYPGHCCSSLDCKEVAEKAISERPEGYVVNSTGRGRPRMPKAVKDSPDGLITGARTRPARTRATPLLFRAAKGF